MSIKEKRKREKYKLVRDMHANGGISITKLAEKWNVKPRTIYRWIHKADQKAPEKGKRLEQKRGRPRVYPESIFSRIKELKVEEPYRSARMIRRILKRENPGLFPSLSLIDKYLRKEGLNRKKQFSSLGYCRFVREKPNDLWQIDLAGYQHVNPFGKLYLVGLIDDCSRFVVGAQYFTSEEVKGIIIVLRDAFLAYGRPNQIISDNAAQFRNIQGELNTKYSNLLLSLGIEPIFSTPYHPQSKGKIERWFKTVQEDFLVELRGQLKKHPNWTLADVNHELKQWVQWYNFQHRHRGLLNKSTPQKIYFETDGRVYRPLKTEVNWDIWINETSERKVRKTNQISYKGQLFPVPFGHIHQRVDIIEFEDKIEIYSKEGQKIVAHPYHVDIDKVLAGKKRKKETRKISKDGVIRYKKRIISIDYKFAGETVEVKESNLGRTLLVYLRGKLVKEYDL